MLITSAGGSRPQNTYINAFICAAILDFPRRAQKKVSTNLASAVDLYRSSHCYSLGKLEIKMCSIILPFVAKENNFFYRGSRISDPSEPGLPDFSFYNIPKRGKIYQITTKYTKCLPKIPNGC
jgi:hypothetical protein